VTAACSAFCPRGGLRRFRARLVLAACLLAGLWLAPVAAAEPYLALREGLKCSVCHVNVTGGGKRTDFGSQYALTRLAAPTDDAAADAPRFGGRFDPFVSIGANLRVALDYADVPHQQVRSEFVVRRALLYLQVDPLPGELTFYLDQQVAPGAAQAREVFALLKGLPGGLYLKAGRFFLPYGLRVEDNSALVREVSGFSMAVSDTGVELGAEPGPWSLAFSLTNGTQGAGEDNNTKQAVLSAALVGRRARAGASFSENEAADGSGRQAAALFGGLGGGRFVALGELARLEDRGPDIGRRTQLVLLSELNALLAAGMNLKLAYEWHDPDPNPAMEKETKEKTPLVLVGSRC